MGLGFSFTIGWLSIERDGVGMLEMSSWDGGWGVGGGETGSEGSSMFVEKISETGCLLFARADLVPEVWGQSAREIIRCLLGCSFEHMKDKDHAIRRFLLADKD
jgi:hypothetical protein